MAFSNSFLAIIVAAFVFVDLTVVVAQETTEETNFRKPKDDADLRYWLENMVWHHNFTNAEIMAATGMKTSEIDAAFLRDMVNFLLSTRYGEEPTEDVRRR